MKLLNAQYDPAVAISKLTPHPQNANEGDVGAIFKAIEAIGFYGALLVQRNTGYVLAGTHRLQALIEAGETTAPVLWQDVDDSTARKIMLSDNRLRDLATPNEDALASLLQSIRDEEGTLAGTGYDEEALTELLRDLEGWQIFDTAPVPGLAPKPASAQQDEPAREPQQTTPFEPGARPKFGVLIECASEMEETNVYNRFTGEGLACLRVSNRG